MAQKIIFGKFSFLAKIRPSEHSNFRNIKSFALLNSHKMTAKNFWILEMDKIREKIALPICVI